jgi:hypothetical protein
VVVVCAAAWRRSGTLEVFDPLQLRVPDPAQEKYLKQEGFAKGDNEARLEGLCWERQKGWLVAVL